MESTLDVLFYALHMFFPTTPVMIPTCKLRSFGGKGDLSRVGHIDLNVTHGLEGIEKGH